jgi:hypothetical protein
MTRKPITVCVFCGSVEPEIPEQYCAHGVTTMLSSPAAHRVAARLNDNVRAGMMLRENLRMHAHAEVGRGSKGPFNDRPPVVLPGDNVVFLRDRPLLVDDHGELFTIESFRRKSVN